MTMDVDPPASMPAAPAASPGNNNAGERGGGSKGNQQEKTIKVHPLAIIGISDHHTRVQTGGSTLPPNSPVLGLLFGRQDGLTVTIIDAEEVELTSLITKSTGQQEESVGGGSSSNSEAVANIRKHIDLHQKVFPQNEVVGWYRVATDGDDLPNEQDLQLNNGPMREYNESPLFVLMNAETKKEEKEEQHMPRATNEGDEAREKLERDESLPLSIYETLFVTGVGGGSDDSASKNEEEKRSSMARAVFVNLEFELEAFGPERIAVERVFKAQPPPSASAEASSATAKGGESKEREGSAGSVAGGDGEDISSASTPSSGIETQLQSVRSSLSSMNARITIILDFLRKTQSGEIPPDYNLLRQVDGLVKQLPFVMSGGGGDSRMSREFADEYEDMLLLSYLAAVAKTARAVQGYNDKFRAVHESSSSSSREMRRGY